MISPTDIYHVVAAMVPLYVAMILAYVSMRYCNLFTPDQCSGINKFVAKFSIPLLSFQVISSTNPYKLNVRLLLADFLQKMLAVVLLFGVMKFRGRGGLKWIITGVSLATLPNTLIIGIPLLKAMYGDEAAGLVSQVVVLQSVIWYNALLFLFEFDAAEVETMTESPELLATGETEMQPKEEEELEKDRNRRKSVLLNVGKKLVRNPNTHATLLGVIWACIHHRWSIELPSIISNSISILSEGGLGMAMFSLGLFMASRASLIACGTRKAIMAMMLKFLGGPALMAVASVAVRLKGSSFKVAIVQAALPQGIVPFVFAKEYNVHPDVLSTGVIFGMLVTLPISLVYYLLLAL